MIAAAPWRVTLAEAAAAMAARAEPHHVALTHGSMRTLVYAPRGADDQTPHQRDEIYIVHAGSAQFLRDGEMVTVAAGDVLFVPAGIDHRFAAMSDDFLTFVVFWGPEGGEA